ncbi:ABC transporter substrate-binding protein [Nonomuraea sp. NPDC050394]|uniref:ABC transporter substrate-binding protein n=1 Tax=Nonomuraea sp. NPDC050394 TaxID=3364363 RepID=UPI0037ABA61F
MRKRLPIAGLLGLALLASGCGSSEPEKPGKIEISYALWEKNDAPAAQKIIDAFQKANPGVTVKLEITPWDQYWTKLQTAAAGGSAPDVFWMSSLNVRMYAKGGVIAPADESKTTGFTPATVAGYRYDGKVWALPFSVSLPALWYDKKIFDAAGMKYPTADWTWDDVRAAAKKLTDPAKKQWGIMTPMWDQGGFYNTMIQAGGRVLSADGKKSGFDEAGSIQGLEFWTDLMNKDKVAPQAQVYNDTEPLQLFQTGKIGMQYGGSWFAATYAANPEVKSRVDLVPLPKGPAQEGMIVASLANAVSAKTEHPKEATAFAAFFASEEGQKIFSDAGGASISAREGTQDGFYKAYPDFDLKGLFEGSMPHGVEYPVTLDTAKWQDVQNKLLVDAWTGKRPTAEVAKEIAVKMNEILAKE